VIKLKRIFYVLVEILILLFATYYIGLGYNEINSSFGELPRQFKDYCYTFFALGSLLIVVFAILSFIKPSYKLIFIPSVITLVLLFAVTFSKYQQASNIGGVTTTTLVVATNFQLLSWIILIGFVVSQVLSTKYTKVCPIISLSILGYLLIKTFLMVVTVYAENSSSFTTIKASYWKKALSCLASVVSFLYTLPL